MKHRNGRVITGKITGLLAAGALMLTELAGVCMPVTVMAQDELLVDEAAEETLNTQAPEELVGSEDALLENASAEDTVEAAPEAAEPEDILSDEGDSAFNPDTNIFGNDPSTKDQYYVTFTVKNNGKEKTIRKPLAKGTEKPLRDYDFYEQVMTEIDAFLNEDAPARLTGWTVCIDGFNDVNDMYPTELTLNPDGYTYYPYPWDETTSVYSLDGNKDYHFTANVVKGRNGNDGIYVKAVPSVFYNGYEHVAYGTKAKAGKQVADLRIRVYYGDDTWNYPDYALQAGKDYTLTYSNCKDASMELVYDGEGAGSFKSKVSDDKRPKVTVTGKGEYKGYSAEVYFDILPMNLGAVDTSFLYLPLATDGYYANPMTYVSAEPAVFSPGYVKRYKLEGGKVTGMTAQKVYKQLAFAGYDANNNLINKGITTKLELIKGKDYDTELYKWDDNNNCWVNIRLSDPSEITEEGDYLCLIRGKGNFCGAYYGDYASSDSGAGNVFNTGKDGTVAVPAKSSDNDLQFKVTAGEVLDFNKVKVTAKKKQLDYTGERYGQADFGIIVKGADGKELTLNEDYTLRFNMDGNYHYKSIDGDHYGSTISAANNYVAKIQPMGNYAGAPKTVKVKIKGIPLKAKQFVLSAKKLPYGQSATWSVAAGQNLVTDNEDSPYYVKEKERSGSSESEKVKIQIGGVRACGDAIDPNTQVTLSYTHTALSLQDLIDNNTLSVEVEDGEYNVKGAVPAKVTVNVKDREPIELTRLYNGYVMDWGYIPNVGNLTLTFTMKKNTKVGDKATLIVKASGAVTGSKDYTYNVKAKPVDYVNGISSLDFASWYSNGSLIAVPTFGQQNKGKLDAPKVKLYQVYTDKKGGHLATVSDKLYKLEKKADVGSKSIAVKLVFKNVTGGEFDFGEEGAELEDIFALYEKTIKASDIASVKIDGSSFSVVKGRIIGDFDFTTEKIRPSIESVTLTDGTELSVGNDFITENGSNRKVGKGTGSVKLIMKYNSGADTFVYGGECTLKFDIKEAKTVKL